MLHKNKVLLAAAASALLAAGLPAWAQNAAPNPAPQPTEQVIVPQVDRRDMKLPRFASNDFSVGLFAGSYATQNFGNSAVSGLRLGYHVTEDIFVEGSFGRTKVSDEDFRVVFPGVGIFPTPKQTLSYYNVVAGYNLLPGEVFFGRSNAKISQGYVVAGVGSTDFAGQKRQTITAGFGLRVVFKDWLAVQADVRDHIFSLDLLGKRQNTQNIEISAGITFFF
jgi:outer membrane beta-barrel protein